MSKKIKLAWAAGFFDGEGCISLLHANNPGQLTHLQLSIEQKGSYLLHQFQNIVGFGYVYVCEPHHKTQNCRYSVLNHQVIMVLSKLWPYLGPIKKEQALRKIQEINRPEYSHLKTIFELDPLGIDFGLRVC